jgi:CheY-specific phosphatase CheX
MPNPDPNHYRTAQLPHINDLRKRFALQPLPSGVGKIAGILENKEKATINQLTRILDADRVMTQRLIMAAYPKAANREGATIQSATARLGLNRVILMLVGEMLTQSVVETFDTMLAISLETDDGVKFPNPRDGLLMGSVKFNGKANGEVTLAFSSFLGVLIAARSLGGNIEDKYPPEVINDAVGEMVNIITGNLQSRLADAGMPSEVALPEVKIQTVFPTVTILGGDNDRFYFKYGTYSLGVNLCIAPFGNEAPQG